MQQPGNKIMYMLTLFSLLPESLAFKARRNSKNRNATLIRYFCSGTPPPNFIPSGHVSYARDSFGIPTRGTGRCGAALWMTRNDENDDGRNVDHFRPILNPFVAAALGATLLSGDPTATLAEQGTGTGTTLAPPAIVLAAQSTTAGADLKDLLGEVRFPIQGSYGLAPWRALSMVVFSSLFRHSPCPPSRGTTGIGSGRTKKTTIFREIAEACSRPSLHGPYASRPIERWKLLLVLAMGRTR